MKPIASYIAESGINAHQLARMAGIDRRVLDAIVKGNFTASPEQRHKLAEALGIAADEVCWDHAISVQHLRGNGPQTGRMT